MMGRKDEVVKQQKSTTSNPGLSVLRQGDNLDIISKKASSNPSFTTVVQELFRERLKKIKSGEAKSLKGIRGKAGMLEVMEAVNESEVALQQVLVIRDKFVNAYTDILKMTL